ncbi:YhgE/Pip domain-containing protein [Microbacterium protaetiae]|uniref:YhgE/Pip domain-containing protein n=1 Tax=Microbacterium protaetiae TaxID=2509458 RepID=A0A4P6EHY9_9MICO|nr:YhgE/Pip domain-containing protein [Microbacterium protaetiae]QAY59757.1 YhgE/Pip domain-containing protein [Microbacterium protaetiae]
MKIPAMITAELRRLTSTKMGILALIALLAVPILYGGLYLWANQDPYGQFSEVPVALVVADEGQGEVNYGDQIADELIEGKAFDWQRMTTDEAADALHHGEVDFTVTIPKDFSDALTSVSTDQPRQATIELETNDANNYLASTIGDQAVEKIRASVAQLVGREAAGRMLTALSDIRGSLVTAADGAAQLTDGAQSAHDGAGELRDGAAQLSAGAQKLSTGAHQVADGASQLTDGAATLSTGATHVADGAAQVADGTRQIAEYADAAGSAVQTVTDALPDARSDIADLLTEQGLDQSQIDAVLAKLDPVADKLRDGDAKVQDAVGKIDQLASGADQVSAGAAQVADGAADLTSGAATLSSGADQVADGTDAAVTGSTQLRDGATALQKGLGTLTDGAAQLRDGLSDGVDQIPASTTQLRTAQAKTIADPVEIESGKVASAEDYGAGLAPFFAALAGWIGIYALFLIVKPISKRAVTALRKPIRVTIAGWLTPAVLGGVQMIGLFGVLALALGFGFANPWGTLGVMVAASFTYTAIILALNVWLGSVGQFLGLVIMVLQLVTAGGTFPWQTLPAPLAALHHVLPMGYVVDAMRQLMYGGDLARAGADLGVLALWLVGSLAVAALGVTRMTHRRTLRDLQPSLIG